MISHITTRGTSLTEGIQTYLEKRFSRLDKYLEKNDQVNVKLEVLKLGYKVEVTITGSSIVRGEAKRPDLYEAIDDVEEVLLRNLVKRKEKKIQRHRHNEEIIMTEAEIVREKKHRLESMTQDEACEQMEMTGHSFFVYRDASRDDAVCVIYLREDSQYGVLIFE